MRNCTVLIADVIWEQVPFSNEIGICKTKQGRLDAYNYDSRNLDSHWILIDIAEHICSWKLSKSFRPRSNWQHNDLWKWYYQLQFYKIQLFLVNPQAKLRKNKCWQSCSQIYIYIYIFFFFFFLIFIWGRIIKDWAFS